MCRPCRGVLRQSDAPTGTPATIINGAGATFPYPIYSKWAYSYEAATGVRVNYQSLGSGAGISQIKNKTVDFGASDSPLTIEDLNEAKLVQFPLVVGGIVPVVHIEGVGGGKLRLTPKLLANIFLGRIKNWDDPALKAANPDLKLPAKEIAVVHRADGSGTTWIFTSYLAETSADWKQKVGVGKSVSWPAGVGGKGNEGVAAYVKRIDGSIGYVEYAYALQNKMPYAMIENRAGKFPAPTIKSFQAAAANADWKNAPGYYVALVNQPGDESWPITGASFILIHKDQANAQHGSVDAPLLRLVLSPGGGSRRSLALRPHSAEGGRVGRSDLGPRTQVRRQAGSSH